MIVPFETVENKPKKWFKTSSFWILTVAFILVIIIVIFTIILLITKHRLIDDTQFQYKRVDNYVYEDKYELYQLNISSTEHSEKQYKLLGDFLRQSLFNRSTYEQLLPSCPIIYSMSSLHYPGNWRAMLFATKKYPNNDLPYPYVCFLSVLPTDRRHKLASILLNQFINEMSKTTNPSVSYIQLHVNWENCPAQNLYYQCGFRCNQFTLNGYSKPFEPEYQYGHRLRLELNLSNIKDLKNICYDPHAVEISSAEEDNYRKLCQENMPAGMNSTCAHF